MDGGFNMSRPSVKVGQIGFMTDCPYQETIKYNSH